MHVESESVMDDNLNHVREDGPNGLGNRIVQESEVQEILNDGSDLQGESSQKSDLAQEIDDSCLKCVKIATESDESVATTEINTEGRASQESQTLSMNECENGEVKEDLQRVQEGGKEMPIIVQ